MNQPNVRYGILGFGRFAERTIAPAFRASPNAELIGIQKRSLNEAQEKSKSLSIPLAFDSAEKLVSHPEIDAVFIVSANALHCPETLAAARAGKHVLVEKPMGVNVAECRMMIDACRRNGVKLMVGHMVRFSPLIRRMKEIIRSGALGPIVLAKSEFIYDSRLTHRSWLFDTTVAGGGPVFDVGVHCLDTMRFLLDDEVVSTKSQTDFRRSENRTESAASLSLKFARGTIGCITCSYASPIRRTTMEIIGTDGILRAEDFTLGEKTLELIRLSGNEDKPVKAAVERIEIPNLYVTEIVHFSECILSQKDSLIPGEEGLRNQEVLDASLKE